MLLRQLEEGWWATDRTQTPRGMTERRVVTVLFLKALNSSPGAFALGFAHGSATHSHQVEYGRFCLLWLWLNLSWHLKVRPISLATRMQCVLQVHLPGKNEMDHIIHCSTLRAITAVGVAETPVPSFMPHASPVMVSLVQTAAGQQEGSDDMWMAVAHR